MRTASLFLFGAISGFAQDACPSIVFQGAAIVPLSRSESPATAVGLLRQPDRSFTAHVYQAAAPYTLLETRPNFESAFFSCFGHPPRTLGSQAVSMDFSEPLGSSSTIFSIAALGANGNAKALVSTLRFNRNGLAVGYGNADFTPRTRVDVNIAENPHSQLLADFNGDGLRDAFVFSSGAQFSNASAAFLPGNTDGTFGAPSLTMLGGSIGSATAQDFDKDGRVDVAVSTVAGSTYQFQILRNTASGFTRTSTPLSVLCFATVAADFNKDGNLDLACADSASAIRILPGNGNGTFRPEVSITLPLSPAELAFADLNRDGNLDLVTVGRNGQGILAVLLGDGALGFPTRHYYAAGYDKYGLFVIDFDADGHLDVVQGYGHSAAVTHQGPLSMTVLFGRGDGTLAGTPGLLAPRSATRPVVADLNGDSRADIVVAARSGAYTVYLAGPAANFAAQAAANFNLTGVTHVTAADLNGDARPDLILASSQGIHAALNDGSGRFLAPSRIDATSGIVHVDVGDFNGDGRPDLAAARPAGAPTNAGEVLLFLGAGGTNFTKVPNLAPGSNPGRAFLRDLDQDSRAELIVVLRGVDQPGGDPGGLRIYRGNAAGAPSAPESFVMGRQPSDLSIGDLNGDGRPDLAAPVREGEFGMRMGVLLSTATGFSPPQLLPVDFGPGAPVIADFNGDGLNDLMIPHCCGDTEMGYLLNQGGGQLAAVTLLRGNASIAHLVALPFSGDPLPGLVALPSEEQVNLLLLFRNASTPSGVATAVSSASYTGPRLGAASIVSIFGNALAPALVGNTQAIPPEELGGVSVTVRDAAGKERRCGLFFVSPGQVNVLLPPDLAIGPATVMVRNPSGLSAKAAVTIEEFRPGLYAVNAEGLAAANLLRVSADGTQTLEPLVEQTASGELVARPIDFGPETDQLFLLLYGTGIRGRGTAPRAQAFVGGAAQTVLYAGPQGDFAGLDQVNVRLNRNLAGRGATEVFIRLNFSTQLESNRIRVTFR